ncbi:cytochrome P450 [Actinomadura algeriensis]|uniref:Cytochrome P450 n=1 Tax=Actinomadura algeriensis TaxID=1679523 RepID=A0ABR9JYR2_9ACTN|nr:cytochrome P450 [Actinomadura algeriensis]MBE1535721.1 cytochrome P450 [Actinomadura algeriensis]
MDFDPRDPYSRYARARAADGPTFVPELDAWLVARDADVRAVLRDAEAFSSANALRPDVVPGPEAVAVLGSVPSGGPVVVTADGDEHRRLREPLTRGLSPKRVAAAVPFITGRAEALVAGFAADGRVELMGRYARVLPGEVIGHLLGLDPADVPAAVEGSYRAEDLVFRPMPVDEQVAAAQVVAGMKRMLDAHVRARGGEPGDDLCGEMIRAIGPHATLLSNLQNILLAGHLTTTALIGNAVLHLLRRREQWELLCERPELIPAAVEETARYEAPVQGFRRVTTRPVTLAGTDLPEGAAVFVAFGAAGRDEAAHHRPDEFDITRPPGRHLAFGHGAHACPGANLAREQARIALETLTRELPGLRVAEPVEMPPNLIHRSPAELFVTW